MEGDIDEVADFDEMTLDGMGFDDDALDEYGTPAFGGGRFPARTGPELRGFELDGFDEEEGLSDARNAGVEALSPPTSRPALPDRPPRQPFRQQLPPRKEPYKGFWDRRDLPRIELSDFDKDGELQAMSLEELEERATRRWGLKQPLRKAQRQPAIQMPGRQTYARGGQQQRGGAPPPRPREVVHSTWGSFPPLSQSEMKNVLGIERDDSFGEDNFRQGFNLPGQVANSSQGIRRDPTKAPIQKEMDGWLMPSRRRPERKEETPDEDSIDITDAQSGKKGESKFAKLYRAALRNVAPLPWERVEGQRSWTDPSDKSWEDLGITGPKSKKLIRVMKDYGVMEPNVLQAAAVPEILLGDDVVLSSGTGSGKTLAFLVPLLHKVLLKDEIRIVSRKVDKATPVHMIPKVWARPQLLVVAPSRELAAQIHRVVKDLLEPFPELNCTLLIGGANHARQDESLKYKLPAVVIGTPGRIMDHAAEGRLDLRKIRAVVMDEIDMLLKVSRQDHLRMLVEALPPSSRAQRILVSATGQCCDLAEKFAAEQLRAPWKSIGPRGEVEMPPRVLHLANGAPDVDKKMRFLKRLSASNPMPNGVLVFCNNFERARKVAEGLRWLDIPAEVLSGNRSKESREKAIRNMDNGKIDMLVATDVATRGLDFREVTHVVNFELPGDANTYAHRAGRCGRMGRNGIVISLGGGGAENHRLKKFSEELGFELLESNVQDNELCLQDTKKNRRIGLVK